MDINYCLSLFYHPVTMVILGSIFGWLFVSYVWTPYISKKSTLGSSYKKEVFLRLDELEKSFENQYATKIVTNLLEGKTSFNPIFINYTMNILIKQGWSVYVYQNIAKTLDELVTLLEDSNTIVDKEKTKKGLLLLDILRIYLKNIKEK